MPLPRRGISPAGTIVVRARNARRIGREPFGLNVDQLRLHGSVFAFSSIVGGIFFSATGSVFLAVVASLGTGIAAGIVNGLFISRLKVP